jgi:lipopolysaccharide biosynthesis glycosyltransferase
MTRGIYIWGAGHYGVLTALDLESKGVKIKGFIDKNATQIKTRFGFPVMELNKVKNQNSQIIIAVQNREAINEIVKTLLLAGLKKNIDFKISTLINPPSEYFEYIEEEINYYRNAIKERKNIYFHDEETAKSLADTWNGTINKPKNLRFIENAIPVVLCANESYAPYLAVMLQSLLDNSNSQRKYHFIILERDFSAKTKDCLMKQVLKFSYCEIDFIDIKSVFNEIPVVSYIQNISIDTFSRFFIPYWFDKYPKVIYLDSDMLVKADIAELYDLDISGFCIGIALCQVTEWHLQNKDYAFFLNFSAAFIFIENWNRYINAGVLVFDIQKFREKFSYQDIFRFAIYFTNRYTNHFGDQDVLALFVKEDYFILPPEWNYQWRVSPGGYRIAESSTKIIHFICQIKPWKYEPEIKYQLAAIEYRNYAVNVPLYRDSLANEH